ncbi:MAG: biotin/lipoyl-binding protein [Victivallales bacterium]|nr:biotin/lipoyl-binding protein [Victivallales bacterium]
MLTLIKQIIKKVFVATEEKDIRIKLFARTTLCIIIILSGVGLFKLFSSFPQKPKIKPPEKLLKTLITVPVNIKDYRYSFTGYGTVKPLNEIKVSSEVKGNIIYENELLEEGNFVKKGTVLLKIEKIDYELALKEAKAKIDSFKIKINMTKQNIEDGKELLAAKLRMLELCRNDCRRMGQLSRQNAVSTKKFEEAEKYLTEAKHSYIKEKNLITNNKLKLKSLQTDLERAKVSKKQAAKNLQRTVIKAPINGRLENINVTTDEYVSNGTPLFEINSNDKVEIDVPVEIKDALYLMDYSNTGAHLESSYKKSWFNLINNISVKIFWTGDLNLCKWTGKIVRIKNFDAETRTLILNISPVKYIGKNKKTIPLVEGMFCKIIFTGKPIKNTVQIPWAALQLNKKIYVVDKDGIVKEKTPKIINSNQNTVIISSKGLEADKHIVAQRIPEDVVNGTKVKILTLKEQKQP